MLASFAEAGAILEREDYTSVAQRNAKFVLDNLRRDGLLLRTFKGGQAKLNGYLEDYAFLIDGIVTLYQTTGALQWLEQAIDLSNVMISEFWDDEDGAFFFTGKSHEQLIVRSKDYFDNATPAGNSVATEVLLHLAALTSNEGYSRQAVTVFRLLRDNMKRYPSAFGRLLGALDFYLSTPAELAIIGASDEPETKTLLREIWGRYLPNKIVALSSEENGRTATVVPLLQDKTMIDARPTAYVCESYSCKAPTTSAAELATQLAAGETRGAAGNS